jgi:hypothetical protein
METATELIAGFDALPLDERAKAAKEIRVRSLPEPPAPWIGPLWLMVVGAFVVLLLGGGFLLFLLVQDDKSTEVIGPLVTGALGVLAGLLAPSPVSSGGT